MTRYNQYLGYQKSLLMVFILCLALLGGCASPEVPSGQVSTYEYNILKQKYDTLQFNYDSLKRASVDSSEMLDKYNGMINELQALRAENAVLKGQTEALTGQYNNALAVLTTNQKGNLNALDDMNRQLIELNKLVADTVARHKMVDDQIKLVQDKKVQLLSDNLTADEYKAFYKGWGLLGKPFNE